MCSLCQHLVEELSCPCGRSFNTKAAFAVHQFKAHGIIPTVCWYAHADGFCHACRLQFANRQGLIFHLQRSVGVCLLNVLLKLPALSPDEEAEARRLSQAVKLNKIHKGIGQYAVEHLVFRVPGPLWNLIDIDGTFVGYDDKRHPWGPGKKLHILPDIHTESATVVA